MWSSIFLFSLLLGAGGLVGAEDTNNSTTYKKCTARNTVTVELGFNDTAPNDIKEGPPSWVDFRRLRSDVESFVTDLSSTELGCKFAHFDTGDSVVTYDYNATGSKGTFVFTIYTDYVSENENEEELFAFLNEAETTKLLSDLQTIAGWNYPFTISVDLGVNESAKEVALCEEVTGPCAASAPTNAPADDDDDGGLGGLCFSADDTVHVQNQGKVAMKDLTIGDAVLVAKGKYEPVYAFGHYKKSERAPFVQVHSSARLTKPLELTKEHLLYVKREDELISVRADQVKVGDNLSSGFSSENYEVSMISNKEKEGLYMPLTKSGTIVVNGILASSYISITDLAPEVAHHPLIDGWLPEGGLLHLWLSPYRMYCMGVMSQDCGLPKGGNGILKYLVWGEKFAKFGNSQSFAVQIIVGIPLLILFGSLYAIELLVGPAMAPLLFVITIVLYLWRNKNRNGSKEKCI